MGLAVVAKGLELLHGTWGLPRLGVEPVTPVLAGGLFTIQPRVKILTKLNSLCLSVSEFKSSILAI